jgi:lipid II isoglutaminyl synthase (glutamine-hydrolysing)
VRRTAAIVAAKTTGGVSRLLRVGGGTALPGLVAEQIDPGVVPGLAKQLGMGSLLVTGTNGKTTTARMIRNIVEAAGLVPVANREGSNMMRGVAAALTEAATWDGKMPRRRRRVGIFEVDEATMPLVAHAVNTRAVVFTNLFRDQLDRYGEVEAVAAIWRKAAGGFQDDVTLVINADDPAVASLREHARGPVILYGLDDASQSGGEIEHAADARWCPNCGAELAYDAVFYGHIGHWRCSSCGNARRALDVACTKVTRAADGTDIDIRTPSGSISACLPLAGVYNAYNALAAAAAGVALGLDDATIERGLAAFTPGFGRQEKLKVAGRDVQVILAKNPAGVNQVLRTITADGEAVSLAVFLNDDIADGRDISWIWDVDFERLAGKVQSLTVSGVRAWDMALRLKYAGVSEAPVVEQDAARALRQAIDATKDGGTLYVIPTYTAMLNVRNILGRWSGRGAFWEGDGR